MLTFGWKGKLYCFSEVCIQNSYLFKKNRVVCIFQSTAYLVTNYLSVHVNQKNIYIIFKLISFWSFNLISHNSCVLLLFFTFITLQFSSLFTVSCHSVLCDAHQTAQAIILFKKFCTYCFFCLESLTPKHLQDSYLFRSHSPSEVFCGCACEVTSVTSDCLWHYRL